MLLVLSQIPAIAIITQKTIIYNPGPTVSDSGSTITLFELKEFGERTCICALSTVAHQTGEPRKKAPGQVKHSTCLSSLKTELDICQQKAVLLNL